MSDTLSVMTALYLLPDSLVDSLERLFTCTRNKDVGVCAACTILKQSHQPNSISGDMRMIRIASGARHIKETHIGPLIIKQATGMPLNPVEDAFILAATAVRVSLLGPAQWVSSLERQMARAIVELLRLPHEKKRSLLEAAAAPLTPTSKPSIPDVAWFRSTTVDEYCRILFEELEKSKCPECGKYQGFRKYVLPCHLFYSSSFNRFWCRLSILLGQLSSGI